MGSARSKTRREPKPCEPITNYPTPKPSDESQRNSIVKTTPLIRQFSPEIQSFYVISQSNKLHLTEIQAPNVISQRSSLRTFFNEKCFTKRVIENDQFLSQSVTSQRSSLRSTQKCFTKRVIENEQFLRACLDAIGKYDFDLDITQIYEGDLEVHDYSFVVRKFGRKKYLIDEVIKVKNPFLLLSYELKKRQHRREYGHVEERYLFHGTKRMNIPAICEKNFDWRKRGTAKGVKFGQGVSFTPSSYYAHHYGDAMILAKVLIGSCCRGCPMTVIPPEGYDTTTNQDNKVFVKYEDECFYPTYIIHYNKWVKD